MKHRVRVAVCVIVSVLCWPQYGETAQLKLTWQDKSNNETGFRIERRTGVMGPFMFLVRVGKNKTSYIDTTVIMQTTYCYRVAAVNAGGRSAYSNIACGKDQ